MGAVNWNNSSVVLSCIFLIYSKNHNVSIGNLSSREKKEYIYTINYLQKISTALGLALQLEIITFKKQDWDDDPEGFSIAGEFY